MLSLAGKPALVFEMYFEMSFDQPSEIHLKSSMTDKKTWLLNNGSPLIKEEQSRPRTNFNQKTWVIIMFPLWMSSLRHKRMYIWRQKIVYRNREEQILAVTYRYPSFSLENIEQLHWASLLRPSVCVTVFSNHVYFCMYTNISELNSCHF